MDQLGEYRCNKNSQFPVSGMTLHKLLNTLREWHLFNTAMYVARVSSHNTKPCLDSFNEYDTLKLIFLQFQRLQGVFTEYKNVELEASSGVTTDQDAGARSY